MMKQPKGVGGWLLLFVILQCFALAAMMYQGVTILSAMVEPVSGIDWSGSLENLLMYEFVYVVLAFFTVLAGLFLIAVRAPWTPVYWQAVLAVLLAGQLGDMGLFHLMLAEMPHDLAESLRPQMVRMLGSFAAGFLWLLYWFNSKRVANTFADAPAVPPPLPSTTVPAGDPFRGRSTRFCPQCGRRVLADAEFCGACKTEIPPPAG